MKKLRLRILLVLFVLLAAAGTGAFFHYYTGTERVILSFHESGEEIPNPSRGFYCQVDTSKGELPEEIEEENLRLILLTLDLKENREGEIPLDKLEELEQMLIQAHEAGVRVIFRAAYGFDSEDAFRDPEDIERVAGHIRRLAPVLNAHKKDILCVQAGFLGPWGEWHHSNLIADDTDAGNRNRVLEEWTGLLEEPVTVNVRRPRFIRDAVAAGIPPERLGMHNDALLAGDDDMGTYDDDDYTRQEELLWAEEQLTAGVNGGEMPALSDYTLPENAQKEFEKLHLTYLNRGYNREVLEDWKRRTLDGESAYDVISRRLGYRLFLKSAQLGDGLRDFHRIELDLTLENSGFAPVIPGYRLYGVIDTGAARHYVPAPVTLSHIDGGESASVHLEIRLSELYKDREDRPGVLRTGLLLTDRDLPEEAFSAPVVEGDSFEDGSIRLASRELLWENGINYIGQYEIDDGDAAKYRWSGITPETGAATADAEAAVKAGDTLQMVFFKIGKADAILLSSEGKNLLIDTGEEDDGEELLDYMRENGIDRIDGLILTHFDKDHVGGADQIVENMEVKQVYQPDYDTDSRQFEEYDMSVKESGTPVYKLKQAVNFSCGGMEVRIYPPLRDGYEEENDFSLITSITYGKERFLFAGDAETERLRELTEGEQELYGGLAHTLLKVPHHGRSDRALAAFFDAVKPSYAVITCSDKNPADREVLSLLEERDAQVYLTADGNVYGTCDGESLTLWQ